MTAPSLVMGAGGSSSSHPSPSRAERREARLEGLFREIDGGGAGHLELEDLAELFRHSGADAAAVRAMAAEGMQEFDPDGDGRVDYGEWIAMWARTEAEKGAQAYDAANKCSCKV